MSANEKQVAGTHYATGGVQHWDFVVQTLKGRYLEGNITKYIARCYKKNGIVDVNKALHYCEKLMDMAGAGIAHGMKRLSEADHVVMNAFIVDAGLDYWQKQVILRAATWCIRTDLDALHASIVEVGKTVQASEPGRSYVDPDS